jgi:hypothetical protein
MSRYEVLQMSKTPPPNYKVAKCCGSCKHWNIDAETSLGDGMCRKHPRGDGDFVVEFISHVCDDWEIFV